MVGPLTRRTYSAAGRYWFPSARPVAHDRSEEAVIAPPVSDQRLDNVSVNIVTFRINIVPRSKTAPVRGFFCADADL
jgi:hypothetical protein